MRAANTQAGVVFDQTPAAGMTASSGAKVTISYYGTLPVPPFNPGEAPQAYCQRIDPLGFNYAPSDKGQGPAAAPANVIEATSPTAGGDRNAAGDAERTVVPGRHRDQRLPGHGRDHLELPTHAQGHGGRHDRVESEPGSGDPVTSGATITAYYDPTASVSFAEFHRTGTNIYYLSTDLNLPSGFQEKTVVGYAYPQWPTDPRDSAAPRQGPYRCTATCTLRASRTPGGTSTTSSPPMGTGS